MKEKEFIESFLNKKTKLFSSISDLKKNTSLSIFENCLNFSESYNGKLCKINFNNNKSIVYSYQRHDLNIECCDWSKFLYNIVDNNNNGMFFSCCMASISVLLMVFNRLNFKKAIFSNLPYFEAFDFCEEMIKEVKEYKNTIKGEKADFLWLCSASPDIFSIDYKSIDTSVIVLDTSCFSVMDDYIINLYNYCKNNDITLIFTRSHMKLDCFALEINRLGSLLVYNDKYNIIEKSKNLRIFLGNNTTLNNIYPWLGEEEFFKITHNNVLKTQNITKKVLEFLDKNLNKDKYEVKKFDHNVYLTIRIKNKVDNLDLLNTSISKYCQNFNLPINTASSFFLEKIGLDNFVRRLDNNNQFLRISLSMWVSEDDSLNIASKIVEYLNKI